jgi:hypothetical protein
VQTDRTNPNNKLDITIHGNEKETCILMDVEISGDRNVIKKEAEKILKYKDLTIEILGMWNFKNEGDTSNNRGEWDYFKVIQKIRKQHTRKACSQGTPENSHIAHCAHTSESTNVKVQ